MVEEMAPLRSTGYVDPGWEHGMAQDERKKKVKCNYCGKIVSGGIFRLKQHLARISGEVTHCEKVPEQVCLNMRKNLEGSGSGSGRRRRQTVKQASVNFHSNDYGASGSKQKGKKVMGDKNLVIRYSPLRSLGYVDPGWEYCVAQDEKKKKVKCNYCEKIISGGINRFKQHLARIPGEVSYCDKAPEDVYFKMKENMKWHRTGKRLRKPDNKEISALYMKSDNDDEEEEEEHSGRLLQCISKDIVNFDDKIPDTDIRNSVMASSPSSSSSPEPVLKRSKLDSVFLKSLTNQMGPRKQVKSKTAFEKKSRKEVISAICQFFYHAGIPANVADTPYFHKMLELVGQYGKGLQAPSSRVISGRFLQEEIFNIKEHLSEFKASWAVTGCSVMADSWNDVHGRTSINLLVSCPRGVYFVSSVDATDIRDDSACLFKLLDRVVEEIGEENVVQVITKNTASFKTAGKMLEDKRRNLFWTPCAVYSIDRILEDFLNIKWVGKCVDKAKRITRYIYNNTWLLNFWKKEFTEGQDLIKPAVTKFATTYFTIQSLLDQRIALKKMFQSSKFLASRFAKSDEGKDVEKIVLNGAFWKKLQFVRKTLEPIAYVFLRIENDEYGSMSCMYNDMYRAKLAIQAIHSNDIRKFGPLWNVIDNHWNILFHHPLYVAAYFLNPSYRYRPDFSLTPEVIRGLNECIVRLVADSGKRISASMQIPDFVSAKADFGTGLAVSTRTELDPAAWWQQHGIGCLELQHIAVRILSQTCSSTGCEHKWSSFDQVHNKRRNCLSRKRYNDLSYVHYNLRLRECQLGKNHDDSISFDSAMLESVLDDWLVESGKHSIRKDEEIPYDDMEQFYADEMDENGGKGPTEMVMFVKPLDVIPPQGGVTTDDDGLDFLDDDLTD